MKYAFIKLKGSPDNTKYVYMEPRDYERYKTETIFKKNTVSLVIVDKIYIGCFDLLSTWDEIKKYNDDCKIVKEIKITDNAFKRNTIIEMAKKFEVENA